MCVTVVFVAAHEGAGQKLVEGVERLRRRAARRERFDELKLDSSCAYSEASEQRPLLECQQPMRPVDRCSEAALANRRVAIALSEHAKWALEPSRELRHSEHIDARSSKLDRERHPVDTGANVVDLGPLVIGR